MAATNSDLLSIGKIVHENDSISTVLDINAESEILMGHFPNHPVVPGACMLQIVKEVLEDTLKQALQLKKADQLKFMTIIDPTIILTVQLDISYQYIEDGAISVTAKLSNTDVVYFKFLGDFVKG